MTDDYYIHFVNLCMYMFSLLRPLHYINLVHVSMYVYHHRYHLSQVKHAVLYTTRRVTYESESIIHPQNMPPFLFCVALLLSVRGRLWLMYPYFSYQWNNHQRYTGEIDHCRNTTKQNKGPCAYLLFTVYLTSAVFVFAVVNQVVGHRVHLIFDTAF